MLEGGGLCSCQAASSLHPDRRVFISGAVGALRRGTGDRTGHGGRAEQASWPAANHRLKEEEAACVSTDLNKIKKTGGVSLLFVGALTESSPVESDTSGAVRRLAIPIGIPELFCRRQRGVVALIFKTALKYAL